MLLIYPFLLGKVSGAEGLQPVADPWKLVANTSAGQIYHRDIEHSSIPMVMITTTYQADPAQIYAIVTDYAHFSAFVPNVLESRVLLQEDHATWVFHRLRFPRPVSDRIYVFKSTDTIKPQKHSYRVDWQLSDRQFTEINLAKGIRPQTLSGFWELLPAKHPNTTEARYAVQSEPGGIMPAWLFVHMTDRYVQLVAEAIRARLDR